MNKLLLGLALALAVVVWWRLNDDVAKPQTRAAAGEKPLPVESVLRVRPNVAADAAATPAPVAASRRATESPLLAQFRDRADYASLYRSTENESAPEALYLRAEIYSICANHSGKSEQDTEADRAEKRAKFASALQGGSPVTAQRLEAYDRFNRDPCVGLDLGKFDPKTLAEMVARAAQAGDPRAQAWQLAQRVSTAYYDEQGGNRSGSGYRVTRFR